MSTPRKRRRSDDPEDHEEQESREALRLQSPGLSEPVLSSTPADQAAFSVKKRSLKGLHDPDSEVNHQYSHTVPVRLERVPNRLGTNGHPHSALLSITHSSQLGIHDLHSIALSMRAIPDSKPRPHAPVLNLAPHLIRPSL
jgi:hypothetical protein